MPTIHETTAYFDRHSQRLRAERLVDKSAALRELLFARLPQRSRVLEVGAGTGLYTRTLLEDGHDVLAVDLSQSCLDQIRASVSDSEQEARLQLRVGDFLRVAEELEAASFDAVTFIKVLHHFPDRSAIQSAIAAAYRLLRADGRLLIFEPNGSYPLWAPLLLSRGQEHWRNERNVLLIRRKFLESVISGLPGATSSCRYRFVIPGSIARRAAALGELDRKICGRESRWLDYLAVNLSFEVRKPAAEPSASANQ